MKNSTKLFLAVSLMSSASLLSARNISADYDLISGKSFPLSEKPTTAVIVLNGAAQVAGATGGVLYQAAEVVVPVVATGIGMAAVGTAKLLFAAGKGFVNGVFRSANEDEASVVVEPTIGDEEARKAAEQKKKEDEAAKDVVKQKQEKEAQKAAQLKAEQEKAAEKKRLEEEAKKAAQLKAEQEKAAEKKRLEDEAKAAQLKAKKDEEEKAKAQTSARERAKVAMKEIIEKEDKKNPLTDKEIAQKLADDYKIDTVTKDGKKHSSPDAFRKAVQALREELKIGNKEQRSK